MSKITTPKTVEQLIRECRVNANNHGWRIHWQNSTKEFDVPAALMLCVCELAEAMEVWRSTHANPGEITYNPIDGKPEGFSIEIADVLIRLFHLCGDLNIDIDKALAMKMEFNKGRPYKHGKENL